MAVTNLNILNPADKTHLYAVCTGTGAPANADEICTDTKTFPIGTQYTDTQNSKFWVRTAANGVAADFKGVTIA